MSLLAWLVLSMIKTIPDQTSFHHNQPQTPDPSRSKVHPDSISITYLCYMEYVPKNKKIHPDVTKLDLNYCPIRVINELLKERVCLARKPFCVLSFQT